MISTRPRHGSAEVTLPSDREIVITRILDAPPALVFKAWTTPELVRRWWGRETSPLVVCDIDLRPGGRWRYTARNADGSELGWRGTYLDIAAPHRLVTTELFEAHPEGEAQTTLELIERDGATSLTITVLHTTKANRDGHVASGMERGLQHSLDRIAAVIAELPDEAARGDVGDFR
jgi:uncharacterized protein YndB with AHSA1/START domain